MSNVGKVYHIGCQSWQYEDWVTTIGDETIFYPSGTRAAAMLPLYAQAFNTIEVDSTAYGTPALSTIEGWIASVPKSFQFSLKVPRAITHEHSLAASSFGLFDEFVAASRAFGQQLGVILIQLPAAFESTKDNGQNLRSFLERLPEDVRFGIEFRHPGWFVEWTFEELAARNVTLALVAGKWVPEETMFAAFEKVEARFVYLRFMGVRDLPRFDRIYRDRTLELLRWTSKIKELTADEIFVYVDNYFEGHAPATANKIKEMVGLASIDPKNLETQASLF